LAAPFCGAETVRRFLTALGFSNSY
jgi:hypothetical protein